MVKKSKYYDAEDIKNYKEWIEDVEDGNLLRKRYGVFQLSLSQTRTENTVTIPCPKCRTKITGKFGKYNIPVDEQIVDCPIGKADDGHGWFMSVVNLILN